MRPAPLNGPAISTYDEPPADVVTLVLTVTVPVNFAMTPEPAPVSPWLNVEGPFTVTAAGIVLEVHAFIVPPRMMNSPLLPVAPCPPALRTVYVTPGSTYTFSVPLKFSVETHSSEMFETVRLWFSRLIVLTSMRFGPQIFES